MVAQERLLREHFGIDKLALVVGGSMGAQQTYEWAVRFPDKVLRAAPIAGTAQNTPHDFLLAQTMREAFRSDPGWNGGEYKSNADVVDGIVRQAHIWAVVGFSTEFWKQEVWRALNFDFPVRDCAPEKALIPGSELRVMNDVAGHLGLFGTSPSYLPQIDQHLGDLLATRV